MSGKIRALKYWLLALAVTGVITGVFWIIMFEIGGFISSSRVVSSTSTETMSMNEWMNETLIVWGMLTIVGGSFIHMLAQGQRHRYMSREL